MTAMKRIALAAAALALLVLPVAAWSAETAANSSHRKAALELLELMEVDQATQIQISTMVDAQLAGNPAMKPYRDVMIQWMKNTLRWEVFGPRMADVYVGTFTEPELREMITFYKSPTGQKALAKLPQLFEEGAKVGAELAEQNIAELEKMIEARRKEVEAEPKPKGEGTP